MSLARMPRIERLDLARVELPHDRPAADLGLSVAVHGFLFDHPDGVILVDTGVGFGNDVGGGRVHLDDAAAPGLAVRPIGTSMPKLSDPIRLGDPRAFARLAKAATSGSAVSLSKARPMASGFSYSTLKSVVSASSPAVTTRSRTPPWRPASLAASPANAAASSIRPSFTVPRTELNKRM